MKHTDCGGEIIANKDEGVFWCQRCGQVFDDDGNEVIGRRLDETK